MRLYDQHVHTKYSIDSQAEPDDVCRRAIEAGLAGVTFTEHLDTHPDEFGRCRFDYSAIRAELDRLAERYAGRLEIGMGIEVCYQPARIGFVLDLLERDPFDLVLLSVHWFEGRALHVREHWDGLDVAQATRRYLQTVLQAARFCLERHKRGERPFDVLSHLDLVKRYTMRYFQTFQIAPHADLVEAILEACLEADLAIELNTSTTRDAVGEPCPAEWVFRRYVELGGRAVCLGSDAHRPEDVGAGLPEAAAMLRGLQLKHLVVFRNRARVLQPL